MPDILASGSVKNEAPTPSGRRRIWRRCRAFIREGKLRSAGLEVRRGLKAFPWDAGLWGVRGRLEIRSGDPEAAILAFERAVMLGSRSATLRVALADCYRRVGRESIAVEIYRDLIQDGSCPSRLLPRVSAALGDLGAYEEALAASLERARREPDSHEAQFALGFYLLRAGRPIRAALSAIARAHSLDPGNSLYRLAKADLLCRVGWHDEAAEVLRTGEMGVGRIACGLRRVRQVLGTNDCVAWVPGPCSLFEMEESPGPPTSAK